MPETKPQPTPVESEEPSRCAQCGRITSKVLRPDSVCSRCMGEIYRDTSRRGW